MAKDAKTRAKARALYEAGRSLREVSRAVQVSLPTVQKWATQDAWEKGKSETKLARKAEEALEKEAERHGVTKGKVFAKVAELMDAKKTEFYQGEPVATVTDNGTQTAATSLAADLLGMKKVQVEAGDDLRSLFQSMRSA